MDFADRKLYYNRCDPSEALAPDDERNVDLDAEAVGGYRPRGVVWVERLASEIDLRSVAAREIVALAAEIGRLGTGRVSA